MTSWTVAHQAPVYGDAPGKDTGVGCHALLQGIFSTQGSNPGLSRKFYYSSTITIFTNLSNVCFPDWISMSNVGINGI